RLLREIHGVLMQQVRGGKPALTPGEFRTGQNWIGGANLRTARFIPPPPDSMKDALDNLEKYLYDEDDCPVLLQCALIHYQFETIHPFNDGNGRLGRLLITFFLVWRGVLDEPMLYLSAYLKTHQQEYYDRLMQVRNSGNFEAWIAFFLEGVVTVSEQVVSTTKRLQQLERDDIDRLIAANAGQEGFRLLRHLMQQPVVMVKDVQRILGVSYGKANTLIATFTDAGLLQQISKGRRNRRFAYKRYIDILAEGTEMPTGEERSQSENTP
ncbi:MAG: Fic family protein, partial [Guyparkeria sp.]